MRAHAHSRPPMSSLQRKIGGPALVQHLSRDDQLIDETLLAKHGRSARTLSKEGPLRLTLIALAADGHLPTHSADGPVTIHVLDGSVTFTVLDEDYPLAAGDVLILGAGVQHAARSTEGVRFLLTVVQPPAAATDTGARARA
jgi:quercetin dioxygenase-like cupin family protein